MDADRRNAGRVRATVGRLRAGLGVDPRDASARCRVCDPHARRRHLVNGRRGPGSPAAVRRAVSHSRQHGSSHPRSAAAGRSRRRHRHHRRAGVGARGRVATASSSQARAWRISGSVRRASCASSMPFSPERTSRTAAITSCCARLPTMRRWRRRRRRWKRRLIGRMSLGTRCSSRAAIEWSDKSRPLHADPPRGRGIPAGGVAPLQILPVSAFVAPLRHLGAALRDSGTRSAWHATSRHAAIVTRRRRSAEPTGRPIGLRTRAAHLN